MIFWWFCSCSSRGQHCCSDIFFASLGFSQGFGLAWCTQELTPDTSPAYLLRCRSGFSRAGRLSGSDGVIIATRQSGSPLNVSFDTLTQAYTLGFFTKWSFLLVFWMPIWWKKVSKSYALAIFLCIALQLGSQRIFPFMSINGTSLYSCPLISNFRSVSFKSYTILESDTYHILGLCEYLENCFGHFRVKSTDSCDVEKRSLEYNVEF